VQARQAHQLSYIPNLTNISLKIDIKTLIKHQQHKPKNIEKG
jgi:hypothetical protein